MEMILGIPRTAASKIISAKAAAELIEDWTKKSRKIVFTNGCFDILHQGHVRYLAEARKMGSALVVGLNSDTSVRKIKGEKRPILNQAERAELLASLECVDVVVLFDEVDPGKLIETIKPNVLVKGADWPKEKVIGKDTVEALGGSVVNIPLVEGRSTSAIIQTICDRYRD